MAVVVNVFGSVRSESRVSGRALGFNDAAFPALRDLLPPGVAWPRDPDTQLMLLVLALSYEYARVRRRALDVLEEIDPRTTVEMLEDWERVYGLTPASDATIEQRRAALIAKWLGHNSPSIPNITALAAAVGYVITIHEYKSADMFVCTSPCNAPLMTRKWMAFWTVTTPTGDADDELEAALREICPLHTQLNMVFT